MRLSNDDKAEQKASYAQAFKRIGKKRRESLVYRSSEVIAGRVYIVRLTPGMYV